MEDLEARVFDGPEQAELAADARGMGTDDLGRRVRLIDNEIRILKVRARGRGYEQPRMRLVKSWCEDAEENYLWCAKPSCGWRCNIWRRSETRKRPCPRGGAGESS